MKFLMVYVIFISISNLKAEADFLPDYMHPCTLSDPEFNTCVKEQIQGSIEFFTKGIPELGVNKTDPVSLDDISLNGNGLVLLFTNAQMHGLSHSKVSHSKLDLGVADETFTLGLIANLSLTAQYSADGKILILPIQGKGDALIECYGIQVEIINKVKHVKENHGEHYKLVSPTYKYDIQSTTFDLRNLFNGNKQLAETTLKFANENWRQIMDDLAPPAIKQIVKTIIKNINKFLSNVKIPTMLKGYNTKA